MINDVSVELIQSCLRNHSLAQGKDALKDNPESWDYNYDRDGLDYLLGQIIRQLWLPKSHYLISVKATKLWAEYVEGDIYSTFGHDRVYLKKDITEEFFVGNSHTGIELPLSAGDSFAYRSLFHDEHIVPIYEIKRQLLSLKDISRMCIQAVLEKIYICKMLKKENVELPVKRLGDDYKEIIRLVYHTLPDPIHIVGENVFLSK